ncbi:hypothetical protein ACH470_33210 [Streptomyces bottropensis]|uniref:hypothetical protein n=1 Tax=Streptomyces bottropensis TaxID=42235 RepID=UPI003793DDF0
MPTEFIDTQACVSRSSMRRPGGSRTFRPYGANEHEACSHAVGGALQVTADLRLEGLPAVYLAHAADSALIIVAVSRWVGDALAR